MARLRKRRAANGFRYVLDFRHEGKRHVVSLKTSDRRLAEKVKAEIEARITMGSFGVTGHVSNGIKVSEFLKEYFGNVKGQSPTRR